MLGDREFESLSRVSPQIREQLYGNYQFLLNQMLHRSQWFGRLLYAIGQRNKSITDQIDKNLQNTTSPRFLRVSLQHFKFSAKLGEIWESEELLDSSFVIDLKGSIKE